jgi:hypothetical protein
VIVRPQKVLWDHGYVRWSLQAMHNASTLTVVRMCGVSCFSAAFRGVFITVRASTCMEVSMVRGPQRNADSQWGKLKSALVHKEGCDSRAVPQGAVSDPALI